MSEQPGPRSTSAPTDPPSLSVVIPIYNAEAWVDSTLAHLRTALERAGWQDAEIVVVDDGSTDDTGAALARHAAGGEIRVVSQRNLGRFLARVAGLEAATGELVLLCDARVHVHEGSLAFVREQLRAHPDRRVWNGHAVTARSSSPVATFWDTLARIAWRRYLRHPTTTSYGAEDYDYFPKGTGLFLAPRDVLLAACRGFETGVSDLSRANDDTLLLRPLAAAHRINISPHFSCTYHPRTTMRQFVQHTFFRGTVFVDGHVRPGSRFFVPYLTLLATSPFALWLAWRRPRAALAATGAGMAALAGAAGASGVPPRDAVAAAGLAPVFGVLYGAGTLNGMLLRLRARRSRARGRAR